MSVLGMYMACTRYVLVSTGTYSEKQKKMHKTFRFKQWISCTASCTLYNYATSVHFMVISMLNAWYIAPETYTRVARYLMAGDSLVSNVGRGSSCAPCSGHDVTGPDINLNFPDTHFGSARDSDGPGKLKLVVKHSLPVESRMGLTVNPATAVLP
jgi:hypothetical protein